MTLINIFILTFSPGRKISLLLQKKTVSRYLIFYLVMIIGIPFAFIKMRALEFTLISYSLNVIFFIIFLKRVDTVAKMKTVFLTLCLSLLFYSIFTILKGQYYEGRLTFGTMFDPNDLACFFISLIPFGLYFVLIKQSSLKKYIAACAIFIGLSATFLTGSRGGMLGLVAITICFIFSKTGVVTKWHKVFMLSLIVISIFSYAARIDMNRLSSIANLDNDYNITEEEGRLGVWKKGMIIFLRNPILGVGANCFPVAIGYLRAEMGEIPRWQVAHNSYVQIIVETGLIGFIFYLLLIKQCFIVMKKGEKLSTNNNESLDLKLMAACAKLAFIGHLTCAFFLTQGYSTLFTLFFAICSSMHLIVEEKDDSAIVR